MSPLTSLSNITDSCGLYLAESTIPGAGFGVFAGREWAKGSLVTQGDIVIPLFDIDWNNDHDDWNFIWDDYVWAGFTFLGMTDDGQIDGKVSAASPGIGSNLNCMESLVNIECKLNKIDNAGLHRSRDPGVGAFTPYHSRWGEAVANIEKGQELFISYGDHYFTSREHTYGLIPLENDFEVADELLKTYVTRILPSDASHALQSDLWELIVDFPFPSRAVNALPTNVSDLNHIAEVGTGMQHYNASIRDLQWLEQHGKCVDNIRPGPSTIPQAGRGAFATRFIPKGGLVTATPVIHITDKARMIIYDDDTESDETNVVRDIDKPLHRQLLVNYCFGQRNSTILLSPYGIFTSLINHSSKNPNARIQWAKDIMPHPEWLDMSLDDLEEKEHVGLVIEYIALRDIEPNEEILIDYGPEWQQAWDLHVQNWKPGSKSYIPAYQLQHDENSVVRTIHEEPYSDNVIILVSEQYRTMSGLRPHTNGFDWHKCRVLDRYQSSSNNNETLYMVELFTIDVEDDEDGMTFIEYYNEILFGIPRDAFSFRDVGETRDHHLHTSFRHEMMLPDDMAREAWFS